LKGEMFGLLGRTGNDESEQFLQQKTYMVKTSEYTYVGERKANEQGDVLGRTLYLRATKTEREDFHEVYSIMKLLEALGGLYMSLSFIVFVPLLIVSKLLRWCGLLLMGCHQDDVFEPDEGEVKASTEASAGAPAESVMNKNMEEGCESSAEPEAATSPTCNVQVGSASCDAEVGNASHRAHTKFMEL